MRARAAVGVGGVVAIATVGILWWVTRSGESLRPLDRLHSEEIWSTCYAIDEDEDRQARAIGCEAGWGSNCRYEPR